MKIISGWYNDYYERGAGEPDALVENEDGTVIAAFTHPDLAKEYVHMVEMRSRQIFHMWQAGLGSRVIARIFEMEVGDVEVIIAEAGKRKQL